MSETLEEAISRYDAAAHAMQSGVKYDIEITPADGNTEGTSPKHLRTGVNSALVDSAALAKLLIDKGVFTELEHMTALADMMEAEQRRYESDLSARLGTKVTLA